MTLGPPTGAIRSFWMGGYEGADHVNGMGRAVDMVQESGHLAHLDADHRCAAELGIGTIRESIGWRLAEPAPGQHNLSRAIKIAASAQRHGLQVVWTLMHYGTPQDVSLLDDVLCDRFASFAAAVAHALAPYHGGPPVFNPINEISFVAWGISQTNMFQPYRGDLHGQGTHGHALGYAVKQRLVRAALMGIDAIRAIDPRARFLHIEPLVHVAAPGADPAHLAAAAAVNAYQWQTWDMLCGRTERQLGGNPAALDLVGANHYHTSQWEWPSDERLSWLLRDSRRAPLSELLRALWQRYGRPVLLAETSHVGDGRAAWLDETASQVRTARAAGVEVEGLCLYPLVDRPDWANPSHWHRSGLWDVADREDGPVSSRRVLCAPYAEALYRWQAVLPHEAQMVADKPWLIVFSHLRWDFVWHRPQQLMSRLSSAYRILFVEEPLAADQGTQRLERISHGPAIDVLVPYLEGSHEGYSSQACERIAPLLGAFLHANGIEPSVAWFYAPMALPLLAGLHPRAVIYDCIDDLEGFRNAPPLLPDLETALMQRADLILCSGPTLVASKASCHAPVHLLPNGVDALQFAPHALDPHSHDGREAALLQSAIPAPRLGYSGVIDERIDFDLVDMLATAHPDWHFVFVGPVCKVEASELPRHANLHWLGLQPHSRLPHLIAGWDVCLLPFALTAATRRCNPTKLLEYIAAGIPIVSTAVPDVIALHGAVLRWADDAREFEAGCAAAIAEGPATRAQRHVEARQPRPMQSWDHCAARVMKLLDEQLTSSAVSRLPDPLRSAA